MDGEVRIDGFSPEKIRECCNLYLGSEEQTKKLLKEARAAGICDIHWDEYNMYGDAGILRIPIVLLMTCVILDEKQLLPRKKTEIIRTIIELIIDRSTLKHVECKSSELKHLDSLLHTLGEVSWKALQNDIGQLLLIQVILLLVFLDVSKILRCIK